MNNLHILASDQLLSNFLRNHEKPFGKSRATSGKPKGRAKGLLRLGGGGGIFLAAVTLPKPSPASRFDAHPHVRLGTFETKMAAHKGPLLGVGGRFSIPMILQENGGL